MHKLEKNVLNKSSDVSFDALSPGTLIKGKISEVLESGLRISFLGLFTGSVPFTHLSDKPDLDTLDLFKKGQKVTARILYVDHNAKSVFLTMVDRLVNLSITDFPPVLSYGSTHEDVSVLKVEPKFGLWVSCKESIGFVHISHVDDNRVENLDKKFKKGDKVQGRVIGHDYCDGTVLFSLEKSVLGQKYMSLADLKAGDSVKGTVARVESFGVIVNVSDKINGLCPNLYLSDVKLSKPEKLFRVGLKMPFRVVSVDLEQSRLILTHKKSMLGLKHIISSYEDVQLGTVTTGVITAIQSFGCIVTFFNNVRALVPVSEMSYTKINSMEHFHIGQSVTCQILSVNPIESKMRASFLVKDQAINNASELGIIRDCTLQSIVENGVMVSFDQVLEVGFISIAHLSDSLSIGKQIYAALSKSKKTGIPLGRALLLSKNQAKGYIVGSLKRLLIDYAEGDGYPKTEKDIKLNSVYPAVVKSISEKYCFVSIGFLDAIVGIHNVSDGFVSKIDEHLQIGQTVVAKIINLADGRLTATLKPSEVHAAESTVSLEAKFVNSIFESKSFHCRILGKKTAWTENYQIGSVAAGTIEQRTPYGVSVILSSKLKGFVLNAGDNLQTGENVNVRIMDIDPVSRIADLKLVGSDLAANEKVEPENLKKSEVLDGIVELVKEDYAVVCFKSIGAGFCYCLNRTMNSMLPNARYKVGQSIKFTISSTEIIDGICRIVVSPLKAVTVALKELKNRALKNPVDASINDMDDIIIGKVISCKIQAIKDSQLNIRVADNLRGRIHASEIFDRFEDIKAHENPLKHFSVNGTLKARVIGFHHAKTHAYLPISHQNPISQTVVELSMKPSVVESSDEVPSPITADSLIVGNEYQGFITKIDKFAIWAQISPWVLGRIDSLQLSEDPIMCKNFKKNFIVGQAVRTYVLGVDVANEQIDLTLVKDEARCEVGSRLRVRILQKDSIKGLSVYISPGVYGRIHISELSETISPQILDDFEISDVLIATVVSNDNQKIDLSLRDSKPLLSKGMVVQGIVTSISDKGCFVELRNQIYGRVKISELSDAFVKDWKSLIKLGEIVKGKIIKIDANNKQIELSLKKSSIDPSFKLLTIQDLKPEMIVSGEVKKIESFGMFILIDNSSIRGLCHISEVADSPVQDLTSLYDLNDRVQVYILKVDVPNGKVSLSLKPSYFQKMEVDLLPLPVESKDQIMDQDSESESDSEDTAPIVSNKSPMVLETNDLTGESVQSSRKFKPLPLMGFSWETKSSGKLANTFIGNDSSSEESDSDSDNESNKKTSRKEKLKKRGDLEKQIEEREMMLLDETAEPEIAEDYERLILGSPNSSYLWIKYMAFQLELAELEKARKIAERALNTISFREEQERINVLIAYLNLEISYGTPETLQQVFAKACQMCDPKKMHIQLAQIYRRNNQTEVVLIYAAS
jgi:rRNA biogenesis protein RRP5